MFLGLQALQSLAENLCSLLNFQQTFGIRAVGAQSFPRTATDNFVLFAFNTYKPVPNVADLLIDFNIYLNGSKTPTLTPRPSAAIVACPTAGLVPVPKAMLAASMPICASRPWLIRSAP